MDSFNNLIPPFAGPSPVPQQQTPGYTNSRPVNSQQSNINASNDFVTLSPEGKKASQEEEVPADEVRRNSSATAVSAEEELTQQELQELTKLKRRDAEVRAHEQAHLAVAGQYAAGGASFTYQVGPDGRKYAVGGEVPISISKESSPEETIQKMQVVARAALAPASPSTTDRRIAARAAAIEVQARNDLQALSQETNDNDQSSVNETETNSDQNVENSLNPGRNRDDASENDFSISQNRRQMILDAYRAQMI